MSLFPDRSLLFSGRGFSGFCMHKKPSQISFFKTDFQTAEWEVGQMWNISIFHHNYGFILPKIWIPAANRKECEEEKGIWYFSAINTQTYTLMALWGAVSCPKVLQHTGRQGRIQTSDQRSTAPLLLHSMRLKVSLKSGCKRTKEFLRAFFSLCISRNDADLSQNKATWCKQDLRLLWAHAECFHMFAFPFSFISY